MDYPVYTRRKRWTSEEVLFDVNQMAEGYAYYHLGGIISQIISGQLL